MRVAEVHREPERAVLALPFALVAFRYWRIVRAEQVRAARERVERTELAYLVGCAFADGTRLQEEREAAARALQVAAFGERGATAIRQAYLDAEVRKSRETLAAIEAREAREAREKAASEPSASLSDRLTGEG